MIEKRELPKNHPFGKNAVSFVCGFVAVGSGLFNAVDANAVVQTFDHAAIKPQMEIVNPTPEINSAIEYIVTSPNAPEGLRNAVLNDEIKVVVTPDKKEGRDVMSLVNGNGETTVFIKEGTLNKYLELVKKDMNSPETKKMENIFLQHLVPAVRGNIVNDREK